VSGPSQALSNIKDNRLIQGNAAGDDLILDIYEKIKSYKKNIYIVLIASLNTIGTWRRKD